MALVLSAVGAFLYLRFDHELSASLDRELRSRAGSVSALVRAPDIGAGRSELGPLAWRGERFAQILASDGRVLDATPGLRGAPLLRPAELARARSRTLAVEHPDRLESDETVRLLATPVTARGRRLVIVVGASLEDSHEALGSLLALLLVGGPVALLLASLAGYGVAAAALRPVEAMRRRAAEIGEADRGERLPVPATRDEVAWLGETLNAMLARLEAAFARERAFVSDASHELRTPLAILKAELELALRDGRSRGQLVEAIRSAGEETERLTRLAEDLLVIARSVDGRLPVRLAPVAVDALLESLRERFSGRLRGSGRELELEPGSLSLVADRPRLEQALANMVDNALRYGEGPLRIAAEARDRQVELHVRDAGPGFPCAFLPEAFERFTRADAARSGAGAGLGLAIVRAIARAHRGEAHAANRESGADVWIELPADAQPGALP
jgi:two-component system, OmpR family, sensor kinase